MSLTLRQTSTRSYRLSLVHTAASVSLSLLRERRTHRRFSSIFKLRRPVRPRLPRPLQCARCSRFSRSINTCLRDERCLRCSSSHPNTPCPSERPRCINCSGTHPANKLRCLSWPIQRKAAVIIPSLENPVMRRQALEKDRYQHPQARQCSPDCEGFRDALVGGSRTPSNNTPLLSTSAPPAS